MRFLFLNLATLSTLLFLCGCSITRFPTLLQENKQAQTENETTTQTAAFNSFIEQKIAIYRQQYQQLQADYQKITRNRTTDNSKEIKNLEQNISVLTDAVNYSLHDKRATAKDKSILKTLQKNCTNLLTTIKKETENSPTSSTTTASLPLTDKNPSLSLQSSPLFGTKASPEGENLLTSGKKPALVIKAATEYETALSTVIKAAINTQTQTDIDIINLTTPQEAAQTSQMAYKIYKEIISMGADENGVNLSQRIDGTLTESSILIYTH